MITLLLALALPTAVGPCDRPSPGALSACPAPGGQPFLRTPAVTLVPECQGRGDAGTGKACDTWTYDFDSAAHFPVPRFDLCGQRLPAEGLVIYEGMRLRVNPKTGEYDVSFTATTPNTPATVRLQLVFVQKTLDPNDPNSPREYKLTLPPIRLEPAANARPDDPNAYTFHVNHRGESRLFRTDSKCAECPSPVIHCKDWCISRLGTARFGTVAATDGPR